MVGLTLGSFGCDSDRSGPLASDDIGPPEVEHPPECPLEGPCVHECMTNANCDGEEICAAAFDPSRGGVQVFECREPSRCVPLDDDTQWCGDDAACCDPSATCTSRGYCVLSSDSTGGTGTGTDTGTDGDTEASTTGGSSDGGR